jgi:prepilin-type processing-associated H-X9-DG protein
LPYLNDTYKQWYGPDQPFKASYEKKFLCPAAKYAINNPENGLYPFHRSYGLNAHIYYDAAYIKERLMSQSARIICMADALDWWFNYWCCDNYAAYGENWQGTNTYGMAAFRHGNKALVSYWDGHVKEMDSPTLKDNLDEWMRADQRQSGQ